jgi:hypothetical protein
MKLSTKILLSLVILLLLGVFGLNFLLAKSKNETLAVQLRLEETLETAKQQKIRETGILAALNAENAIKISVINAKANAAEDQHRKELYEIKSRYDTAVIANKRLRDQVNVLNGKLSEFSRAAVENYAATAANNLTECNATTAELERLALVYNSELERLRTIWPKAIDTTITIMDEDGNKREYSHPYLRIKGKLDDVSVIVP